MDKEGGCSMQYLSLEEEDKGTWATCSIVQQGAKTRTVEQEVVVSWKVVGHHWQRTTKAIMPTKLAQRPQRGMERRRG